MIITSTEAFYLMLLRPLLSCKNSHDNILGAWSHTKYLLSQLPCTLEKPSDTDMVNETSPKVSWGLWKIIFWKEEHRWLVPYTLNPLSFFECRCGYFSRSSHFATMRLQNGREGVQILTWQSIKIENPDGITDQLNQCQ